MRLRKALSMHELVASPDARSRLDRALSWLAQYRPDQPLLVVSATADAGADLCRTLALRHGARFGLQRATWRQWLVALARDALVRSDRVPASRLALTALTARVVHRLAAGSLPHYQPVTPYPGFAPALLETLEELRMEGVAASRLQSLPAIGPDLRQLLDHLDAELETSHMADAAWVHQLAGAALQQWTPVPVLLLDLAVRTEAEAQVLAALGRRSPQVLATAACGDERSIALLQRTLEVVSAVLTTPTGTSLQGLQAHLFESTQPAPRPLDDGVSLASWPGEARECLEIARQVQQAATRGVPFDRMAVLLHSPAAYGPHLEEAFMRAEIPAWFTEGTRRPHPAGRALLALLHCADEGLSANRFAEYLSLAQVPSSGAAATWVPPDHDLLPRPAEAAEDPAYQELREMVPPAPAAAPWRWEQILIDASIIGGLDRWHRRLDGWDAELELQQRAVAEEHPERAEAIGRTRQDLVDLRTFAIPLLTLLSDLPRSGPWEVWLAALRTLAERALRDPEPVVRKLDELLPMGSVGPVALDEVILVLGAELRDLTLRPSGRRYGAVYVAPTAAVRGMAFDVVFIPGLAEKVFPHKIVEDPILLDAARRHLEAALPTQTSRVAEERLSLRLAVGSATAQVHLSYPRLDVQQARPRVPSFYGLEIMRAAEGTLPGYEQLHRRAGSLGEARLGWPAPARPELAIDAAEYDLALLAPLLSADPDEVAGTATYLMSSNPHLARALRSRWARAQLAWTPFDGLMNLDALGAEAAQRHRLDARAYSPTALEQFAVCPYRFYLKALMRLTPREVPAAVEQMEPLTRGSLVHEVQFDILTRLRAENLLPLETASLGYACQVGDAMLERHAAAYEEQLAPAIPRVWEDAINVIRSDLRQWLGRLVMNPWIPERFELSFGLSDRGRSQEDPASVPAPVSLPNGLQVRGSIDLIERNQDGVRRATDYKTGKMRAHQGSVVQGGEILQPLLYAMVCRELLGPPVEGGRLYYCTTDGNFRDVTMELNEEHERVLQSVVDTVADALRRGHLPAAPARRACDYCDFRPVCGPHEEARTGRKPELPDLEALRALP